MKKYKVLPKYPGEKKGYITATDRKAVNFLIENDLLIVSKGCKTSRKYYNVIEANQNIFKIKVFDAEKNMNTFRIELIDGLN